MTQTLDGPTRTRGRDSAPAIDWVRHVLQSRPEAQVTDFAASAGVSRKTVANLLGANPRPSLYSETYERIMATGPEDVRVARRRIIPGESARELVDSLTRDGWTRREIADAGGLKPSTLTPANLDRVHAETVRRLMVAHRVLGARLRRGEVSDSATIPSYRVLRRVEALMTMGWSRDEIARRAGVSGNPIRTSRAFVSRTTADRVFEAFSSMRLSLGGNEITQRQARRFGYAPWVAWPGSTIDQEDAVPDWEFLDDEEWREAIRRRYEPK